MESVIVKSRIKEVAKDCNVSSDFAEGLNKVACDMIKDASRRAKDNGRKTIQAKDAYVGKHSSKVMLVSKSKAKEQAPNDCNVSGDFSEALNESLNLVVSQAVERAVANGRKTIQSRDL